jgi:putative transposase
MKEDESRCVAMLCETLGVSRSGFYQHCRGKPAPRVERRREAAAVIRELFGESKSTYGYRRIRVALARRGLSLNRKTVAAIMRAEGLRGRRPGRFKPTTTDSDHAGPIASNLLALLDPVKPDTVWQTDITYIETGEGWVYLAGIIDAHTRRVVGWACARNMETSLVLRALDNAVNARRPGVGLLHHSDRGSQYASDEYRRRLAELGFVPSMSRRGNCYDNAATESFWSTLKLECLYRLKIATRAEVESILFAYIDGWYNTRRLHSSLGYQSPLDFEKSLTI